MTQKHAKTLQALMVLVLTEATYKWLAVNDPQALKQALAAITIGDLSTPQVDFLIRMKREMGNVFSK